MAFLDFFRKMMDQNGEQATYQNLFGDQAAGFEHGATMPQAAPAPTLDELRRPINDPTLQKQFDMLRAPEPTKPRGYGAMMAAQGAAQAARDYEGAFGGGEQIVSGPRNANLFLPGAAEYMPRYRMLPGSFYSRIR
jgi:hypothetical protein